MLDGERGQLACKIHTGHMDCDLVTFSPCGRFLVSCNATDNTGFCYDIRNTSEHLHYFSHGTGGIVLG